MVPELRLPILPPWDPKEKAPEQTLKCCLATRNGAAGFFWAAHNYTDSGKSSTLFLSINNKPVNHNKS